MRGSGAEPPAGSRGRSSPWSGSRDKTLEVERLFASSQPEEPANLS